MRALLGGMFLVMLTASGAECQEPKKGERLPPPARQISPDFSYFENSLGLRLKSFNLEVTKQEINRGGSLIREMQGRITYVLEFDRDAKLYNFNELQKAFLDPNLKVQHLFFDDDNVALDVNVGYQVQGIVSGRRGESFRVNAEFGNDGSVMWGGVRLRKMFRQQQIELNKEFGVPETEGLVVIAVAPHSAGDKAGLKPNDVLLKINGKSAPNDEDGFEKFARLLQAVKVDKSADLLVYRNLDFEVILGATMPTVAQPTPVAIMQQARKLVVRPQEEHAAPRRK